MSRLEFMEQLEQGLAEVSAEEKSAALQYYNEYFDDAGPDNEKQVLQQLGSAEQVLQGIVAESGQKDSWTPPTAKETPPAAQTKPTPQPAAPVQWNVTKIVLTALIVLIAAPVVISVLGVLGSVAVAALVIVALPLIVGGVLMISGVFSSVFSLFVLFKSVPNGLLTIGLAVALIGAGFLLFYFGLWVIRKLFPLVGRFIVKYARKLIDWFKEDPLKNATETVSTEQQEANNE